MFNDINLSALTFKNENKLNDTLDNWEEFLGLFEEKKIFIQDENNYSSKIKNRLVNLGFELLCSETNVHISEAFNELVNKSTKKYFLFLEHDWKSVVNKEEFILELNLSKHLLSKNYDVVRLRHTKDFGSPLYSMDHKENMDHCPEHLLDSVHWGIVPKEIKEEDTHFCTLANHAAFTNNPCLYKKEFLVKNVLPFCIGNHDLERKIVPWWIKQSFLVAKTKKGIFKHIQ